MIGGAVQYQQDVLSGKSLRQGVEEDLKAFRVGRRQDQQAPSRGLTAP